MASPPRYAFVTLLTSDHYLSGALVLAQSIRLAHGKQSAGASRPFDIVALTTPDTLSVQTTKALRRSGVFDWLVGVEQIGFAQILAASQQHDPAKASKLNDAIAQMQKNLNLLGRPDLRDTLTKLHAWRLGKDSAASLSSAATPFPAASQSQTWQGYEKIVFLDADMLVLRPIDHLFTLPDDPQFAAAPDTGWPDAFNSGLMLLKPSATTFESIRSFAQERGSWDGADQGLLNDYFGSETNSTAPEAPEGSSFAPGGGWKRLSFRYNVTSHGGYTFAPAYQRYGDAIMASHFIGQHKPWNRPRPDFSAHPNPHTGQQPIGRPSIHPGQADYLLALWHDTYASLYPSSDPGLPSSGIEIIHTARGVEVVERRPFAVPTYNAVWDAEARRDRDREDEHTSHHTPEAHYVSLPLDGRASLVAPQPPQPQPSAPAPARQPSPPHYHHNHQQHQHSAPLSAPIPIPSQQHHHHHHHHRHSDDERDDPSPHFSPPKLSWNAAHEPPPVGGNLQMRYPPQTTHYSNAWDEPRAAPRTLAEQKAEFFTPPTTSRNRAGSIPSKLRREHTFANLGSDTPDPSKVKPIFPWEGQKRPSTRVFPDDPKPKPQPKAVRKAPAPAVAVAAAAAPAVVQRQRGLPSTLAYTNAWDEPNAIGGFAHWWTRRVEVGVQAAPIVSTRSSQTLTHSDSDGDDESSSSTSGSDDSDTNTERTRWPRAQPGKGYQRKAQRRGQRSPSGSVRSSEVESPPSSSPITSRIDIRTQRNPNPNPSTTRSRNPYLQSQ